MNIKDFKWTREPDDYTLTDDKIEIITQPGTDLWQRTYYHFRNDNAPVLQIETEEKFFSFIVKLILRKAIIALISAVWLCILTVRIG